MVTEIMSFKDVKPDGNTALRDAIWEAVSMFQPSRDGDTIVVISDGRDNQSKVSMRRLREAMWSRGIRVMFAQFVDHAFPPEKGWIEMNDGDTIWLSESSGGFLSRIEDRQVLPDGFLSRVENPQVLPKVAQEIAFEIENYLAVRITLPTPLEKQASLHLEAVDPSGEEEEH